MSLIGDALKKAAGKIGDSNLLELITRREKSHENEKNELKQKREAQAKKREHQVNEAGGHKNKTEHNTEHPKSDVKKPQHKKPHPKADKSKSPVKTSAKPQTTKKTK